MTVKGDSKETDTQTVTNVLSKRPSQCYFASSSFNFMDMKL